MEARESHRLAHLPQNLKQMKLQEAKQLSQKCVDNAVFSFLVQGCQPFVLVEQPAFQSFVQDLQPNGAIISQTTVQLKMNRAKTTVKENVREAVMKTGYIATTLDCWSTKEEEFYWRNSVLAGSKQFWEAFCWSCMQTVSGHSFIRCISRCDEWYTLII